MARKPRSEWSPSYEKRVGPLLDQGFSLSQARGHASKRKGELPISVVRAEAKRTNTPIEQVPKTRPIEKVGKEPYLKSRIKDADFYGLTGSPKRENSLILINEQRENGKELVRFIYETEVVGKDGKVQKQRQSSEWIDIDSTDIIEDTLDNGTTYDTVSYGPSTLVAVVFA